MIAPAGLGANSILAFNVEWFEELCEKLAAIGQRNWQVRVEFAARDDLVGELGRAFNALAEGLEWLNQSPEGDRRSQRHAVKNALAGLAASAYVLAESEMTAPAGRRALQAIVEEARKIAEWLKANEESGVNYPQS